MSSDLKLVINTSADKVFSILSSWHQFPELRELADVPEYHVISRNNFVEYFWIKVKDLPLKSSYCYGKRMFRTNEILLTMFTYRLFKSNRLANRTSIDEKIINDWDQFYYQTIRLTSLPERRTLVKIFEPHQSQLSEQERKALFAFYLEVKKICEGELVRLGIDTVAEEVAEDDEEAWWQDDDHTDAFSPEEPIDAEFVYEADTNQENKDKDKFDREFSRSQGRYNPYIILGISSNASIEEIKQTYRNLAMQWHPDRKERKSRVQQEYAHNQFIEITTAYHAILKMRKL